MRASHRLTILAALVALASGPGGARAGEADSYGLGNGTTDGSPTNLSGAINRVAQITTGITAGVTLTFTTAGSGPATATNFGANDLVMLWQPTGLSAEPPVSQPVTSLSTERVGRWEIAQIASVAGPDITLKAAAAYDYTANRSQVVRLPQYGDVTIPAGNTVSATAWDGKRGGIVAFLATGTVTLNGTISADAAGFRGGTAWDNDLNTGCSADFGTREAGYAYKGEGVYWELFRPNGMTVNDHMQGRGSIANAGGGGDCHNSGGGGGGHATRGGQGGHSWDGDRSVGGLGGGALDDVPPDRLVFGGGGGAGEENDNHGSGGGVGGGVVFLRAASLAGAGTISANGGNAANATGTNGDDGTGGGGAGGSVVVRLTDTADCTLLSAKGGNGGNNGGDCGGGGGGAGGRVYLQADSVGVCATNVSSGTAGTGGRAGAPGTAGVVEPDPPGGYCWAGSAVCSGAAPQCDTDLGSCVECVNDGQCTEPGKPFCDRVTRVCRACAVGDCAPLHCNTTSGACVQCLSNGHCSNPTPTCSAGFTCVACGGDTDCSIDPNYVCQTTGTLDGACTQCSSANLNYCSASLPACSAASGSCVVCTGNRGAVTDAPCPDPTKPVCTAGLCYQCSSANVARCTTASPACNASGTCVPCDGDLGGSGAGAPCPTSGKPVCTTGACNQCAPTKVDLCTAATAPTCVSGACAACTVDNGTGEDGSCPTSARPFCVASGACHECEPSHLSLCSSTLPACNTTTGLCSACDADHGATGTAPCPYPTLRACLAGACYQCTAGNATLCSELPDKPACLADHTCGCAADADCRKANAVRLCNATAKICFDGCRGSDDRCPAGSHCSTTDDTPGTCVADPGADAGQPDVGQPDAGQPDVGTPDAGAADTGTQDVGIADAGTPDTGAAEDAGVADTGVTVPPDAEVLADATVSEDASAPDGALPDTGGAVGPATYDLGGCGCGSVPGSSAAPWGLLGLALFAARIRRRR